MRWLLMSQISKPYMLKFWFPSFFSLQVPVLISLAVVLLWVEIEVIIDCFDLFHTCLWSIYTVIVNVINIKALHVKILILPLFFPASSSSDLTWCGFIMSSKRCHYWLLWLINANVFIRYMVLVNLVTFYIVPQNSTDFTVFPLLQLVWEIKE